MVIKINLLPWRAELRFKRIYYFKIQMLFFFVASVLILLLWHIALQQKINTTIKQTNYLQRQLDIVAKQIQNDVALKEYREVLRQATNQIISLEKQQSKFNQVLKAIHQGVPINLYATQLMIKGREVKMFGKTKSIADLAQLVARLAQTKIGGAPLIQKISRQNDAYDFVLIWLY